MALISLIKRKTQSFKAKSSKPSRNMLEALKEVNEMINNKEKYPRYDNWQDLKKALLEDD